jgi:hypothetical protein
MRGVVLSRGSSHFAHIVWMAREAVEPVPIEGVRAARRLEERLLHIGDCLQREAADGREGARNDAKRRRACRRVQRQRKGAEQQADAEHKRRTPRRKPARTTGTLALHTHTHTHAHTHTHTHTHAHTTPLPNVGVRVGAQREGKR